MPGIPPLRHQNEIFELVFIVVTTHKFLHGALGGKIFVSGRI
jgi:hypothetical protein